MPYSCYITEWQNLYHCIALKIVHPVVFIAKWDRFFSFSFSLQLLPFIRCRFNFFLFHSWVYIPCFRVMFQLNWYSGFLRDQVAKRECFLCSQIENVSKDPYKFVFISIFQLLLLSSSFSFFFALFNFCYQDKIRFESISLPMFLE